MALVPARELRNHTAAVLDRARSGEDVTITVNGVPTATLSAIWPAKRTFLTTADLLALRRRIGEPVAEYWEHELDGDTTDDLGPIE
jgi:antitoxin (DNA-binding transcriptional repressor) of toxin-antitoxin stability system